jgi:uncharacterized repeat protein (TIGR01451 family)
MKKVSMLLTAILLVSTLSVALAVPVLAHGMTVVDIEASAAEVPPGDPVLLTITESNTGAVPLINVSLTLWDGTAFLSPVLVGNGNGDDILDAGEVWQWEITVYPVTCTVYEATGYGFYKDPVTGKEYHVTWPDWPSERDSVEVCVSENGGGGEGFTPGYWKNHLDDWPATGYDPGDDFDTVFGVANTRQTGLTLGEAVGMKGGGERALIRHAVAALLNAAHPDVDYLYTEAEVIAMVQDAYSSGDFMGVKNLFEAQNELGGDF